MNNIDKLTNHAQLSEKALERYLVEQVESLGYLCLKYSNPHAVGYPDRMILLPGARVVWVELKSAGAQLKAVQRIRHGELLTLGHLVFTCDSREKIDRLIKRITNAGF